MKMTVAAFVADFLKDHGITHCFSVTGGGAMHLNAALGRAKHLTTVYNHHEQASAMAAEAYTRLSGKLAAVCVTSGPGGTNAITGVMGGFVDSIPMLILSGQVKRAHLAKNSTVSGLRQLGDQEFDIVKTVSTMTKYAAVVEEPQDVAYHLEIACQKALEGRGGPAWLDLPLDVQSAVIETEDLRHAPIKSHHTCLDFTKTGQEILQMIKAAKAPLLLVGTGVRLGGAVPLLEKLLQKLQIPAVVSWNANDCIPYDSPFFAGMPGTVGTRAGNFAVQSCDLLLSLGCRLNIRTIGHNPHEFAKNATRILVDIDEKELKKHTVTADMAICADVYQVIATLLSLDYTPAAAHLPWLQHCRKLVQHYTATKSMPAPQAAAQNPYRFLDLLFDNLTANDTVVCGNGSACVMTFQAAKLKKGARMFTNSGCAAMGYGLPAALGAAFAAPDRRTVLLDGDGSIMMNLQELATLAYHRASVKILLLNNSGYHSIRETQKAYFGKPFVGCDAASGLFFPDFKTLAGAFSLPYYRIADGDATDTLCHVLQEAGPCLCEVMIDGSIPFTPKVTAKVLPDGTMQSAALDDMAPFLEEAELRAARYTATRYD